MRLFTLILLFPLSLIASQITDDVDTSYATNWQAFVQAKQAEYRAAKGRYAQLTWSHTEATTPTDGVAVIPTRLADRPSDQQEGWEYFTDLSATPLKSRVKIDVYQSGATHGYVVSLEIVEAGKRWRRVIDYGPAGRTRNWFEVKANPFP